MTENIEVKKNGDNIELTNQRIEEVININIRELKASNIEIFFKKLYIEKVIINDEIKFSFSEDLKKYLPNDDKDKYMRYLLMESLKILNEE